MTFQTIWSTCFIMYADGEFTTMPPIACTMKTRVRGRHMVTSKFSAVTKVKLASSGKLSKSKLQVTSMQLKANRLVIFENRTNGLMTADIAHRCSKRSLKEARICNRVSKCMISGMLTSESIIARTAKILLLPVTSHDWLLTYSEISRVKGRYLQSSFATQASSSFECA